MSTREKKNKVIVCESNSEGEVDFDVGMLAKFLKSFSNFQNKILLIKDFLRKIKMRRKTEVRKKVRKRKKRSVLSVGVGGIQLLSVPRKFPCQPLSAIVRKR